MSLSDQQPDPGVRSPGRPGSSWTNNSLFADSAISVRTRTPGPFDKDMDAFDTYATTIHPGIADRLKGLVSEIWASEQDSAISGNKRRRLERALGEIEAALEDDGTYSEESDAETTHSKQLLASPPSQAVGDEDLEHIRTSLVSTVEAMRMRQQEQRHLHQLTIEKLEAVAQRCIQQERRLREFSEEIVLLQERNRRLIQENERITTQLDQSQIDSARKDLAVDAMSSAVAGLEGWINNSSMPNRTSRRVVTRGRGRFRGRYYVDEPREAPDSHSGPDAKLHEGVTAWLRGFRDVQEELRSSQSGLNTRLKELQSDLQDAEDDWGEFESPSRM
ncbi:hypothetical protein A1O3_02032 [Capronia epimyces CBS 606.96]|uniref:Uncharacterized protein n=1 Tax=Capronia epimyces CBS 606.96 TaxID=1182542 RepID=W9Y8X0_9EURO|nr:uncharacterized protein A1O3_02032 [Capronia epimyces CBS 606.96]EXJ88968.1 hypothetical protein A1O3_02032 [Capronia epimyces CBS 606.96]